jgi:hypothetical protein
MFQDDLTLELSRIVREAEAAVIAKLAARNEGEAFKDLPVHNEETH